MVGVEERIFLAVLTAFEPTMFADAVMELIREMVDVAEPKPKKSSV